MNPVALVDRLRSFGTTLPTVVAAISGEDVRWRPDDGGWSVLEIVRHLGDEEVEDFRMRLKLTLEEPATPWPPIDPEGAATERAYNEADMDAAVATFTRERAESVRWLDGLLVENSTDWARSHEHPRMGAVPAGDMLAAWVAHDALHLRQIAKRLFQLTQRDAGGYSVDYAGEWRA